MQPSHFVVLTGHLNDYPLSDLVGILRHQRKTGRLVIEYEKGPAMFYFKEGELVDAQLDNLSGLQAICVSLAQPGAPFNFNPLIQPSRQSIENSLQRVVSEMLGCWDEQALEIETTATSGTLTQPERMVLPPPETPETETSEALAFATIGQEHLTNRHSRAVLVMAAAGLMMIGISTVIAVTASFTNRASMTPAVERNVRAPRQNNREQTSPPSKAEPRDDVMLNAESGRERGGTSGFGQSSRRERRVSLTRRDDSISSNPLRADDQREPEEATPQPRSVKVIMQIENGRVSKASIANHRSEMDAYEALALRIARQRRYPSTTAGQETVTIQVTQPN
jgi:uncharacterized protein DUF4388